MCRHVGQAEPRWSRWHLNVRRLCVKKALWLCGAIGKGGLEPSGVPAPHNDVRDKGARAREWNSQAAQNFCFARYFFIWLKQSRRNCVAPYTWMEPHDFTHCLSSCVLAFAVWARAWKTRAEFCLHLSLRVWSTTKHLTQEFLLDASGFTLGAPQACIEALSWREVPVHLRCCLHFARAWKLSFTSHRAHMLWCTLGHVNLAAEQRRQNFYNTQHMLPRVCQ